ncbi:hypothetical protein BCV69DRAFT_296558 [Microstroma glucosiphilum]|uniref:Nucleoporin Nup188 N-terminal subdomain III domain-containing protein n=1 Tax=Pseudomicrostroma glucosiphilum TaxID=1684307 RepID=A0A316UG89_9BASI|nr:hypothetical protein BCV69DRAFT_296558 [Pseudomicrostroma glucosiphilum]PWN24276.1 hypothetical protein BCV69DRAFT_296558 [Pseudomicrostroma glucosiphilum]
MPEAAEAGPSSRPAGADLSLCTYHELYEHLENARSDRPFSEVQQLVESRLKELAAACQTSPPSRTTSKGKLSADSVKLDSGLELSIDADQRDLCIQISERYDLEEVQSLLTFKRFLQAEDIHRDLLRTTAAARRKGKATLSDDLVNEILDEFNVFYFEEQLYTIRCAASLLRIAEDSDHQYFEIAQPALTSIGTQDFGQKCLDRFVQVSRQPLPIDVRDAPRYSQFWAKHGLKEQLALLEVVFLVFYGCVTPTPAFAIKVLKTLEETTFGQAQASEAFFDPQSVELVGAVHHCLTLIAIEALDLERAMDGYGFPPGASLSNEATVSSRAFITDAKQLDEVLSHLESASADPNLSPIFLGWALVLRKTEDALADALERSGGRLPSQLQALSEVLAPGDGGEPVWTRLASAALNPSMGFFSTMKAIVGSPLISTQHSLSASFGVSIATSLAFRAVFKGLLLSITDVIRPEYISDQDALVELWEATFEDGRGSESAASNAVGISALCWQFWEVDYETDTRRAVLEMAKRRWPVQFRPFIRLLKSLTGVCDGVVPTSNGAQASTEVLRQLYELPTLAHALPSTAGALRPPWEVIESSDYAVLDYRCTRTIPIFGPGLAVQPGTCGRMVSEAGQTPVVVVWEPSQPVSGWRLLRDVLASFVKLLGGPTVAAASVDRDDVFSQSRSQVTSFANLSPGETGDATVATEIIELFSAVLLGAPTQADALLEHLETAPGEALDPDQSISSDARPTQPSLVVIVQRILDQALNAREVPSRLVSAGYKLLSLLLSLRPSEVWLAVRSSNLVIGSSGQAAVVSRTDRSTASALLAYECSTGDFVGLRSLLAFHASLLAEVQRSQFLISPELSRIKVDTLLRALGWVCESIWPEHQSWRYKKIGEKVAIASSCATLLQSILTDRTLVGSAPGAARDLSTAMDNLLVLHSSSLYIAPLVSVIGTGQALLQDLQRSGSHANAEHAHDLIATCLALATAIILRRQELSRSGSYPDRPCLLERMMFDGSAVAVRAVSTSQRRSSRVQLLSAVVAYTSQTLSASLCRHAGLLMTAICVSAEEQKDSTASGALSVIGHLGSADDVNTTVASMVGILDNSHYDVESRRVMWTMAAAMVMTQPGLAHLLLGGHPAGDRGDEKAVPKRSALSVAVDSIHIWEYLWEHDPALLDAVLHFLGTAWARMEHLSSLQARIDPNFWKAITSIIAADAGNPAEEPSGFEDFEGRLRTDSDEETRIFSHRMLSKARALHILSKDLQTPRAKGSASKSASLESAMALVTNSPSFTASLESAVKVECDPGLHADVESKLATAFPEIPLNALRRPAKAHEFNLTREYGDDYVFDTRTLRSRLEGFCSGAERGAQMDEDAVVDERVIHQAVLMLSSVNLDWSNIDAQTTYLRAWHQLLEALSRAARWEVKGNTQKEKEMSNSYLKAWVACAKITSSESRDGSVMLGIHAARVDLLEVLLEAAWGFSASQKSDHLAQRAQAAEIEILSDVVEQVQKILSHKYFTLQASVRGPQTPAFHRGLFSIALLSARQVRRLVPIAVDSQSRSAQVQTHQTIHQAIDSFTSHALKSMRLIVDAASLLVSSRSSDAAALASREEDLTLVCSLLELLIRPDVSLTPHSWLSQFQEVGLLPACVALLRRAPLRSSEQEINTQAAMFMPALSSLFLALAAQQQSAEQSVLAGLMTALSSNALSPALEAGTVAAVLASGTASPAHACWVTMLRLVVSIVENLDGDASATWAAASVRFIETEVVGFVRLYGAQLGKALSFSPLAARGSVNTREGAPLRFVEQDARITQPQLNELQATMRLFLVMASADGFAQGSGREVMATFADKTSGILQQLVYLTERPHQLASLLLHGGGDNPVGVGSEQGEYEQQVVEQMTSIATTAVAALWHQTRGDEVLAQQGGQWAGEESPAAATLRDKALLRPTMRTAPGELASIGTLLDLAGHCIEVLQKKQPTPASEHISRMQVALEQTLALAVTQLLLNASFPVGSASHQVVESGIQRDVAACVQSGLGAIKGLPAGEEAEEGQRFLSHLASLCEQM